jgi:hypothetical protein
VWSLKHRDTGAFSFSLLKFVGVDASHPKSLTTARRSSDLDQHEKVNKIDFLNFNLKKIGFLMKKIL